MSARQLQSLEQRLRTASVRTFSAAPLERAAQRAVDSTNATLRAAKVPARAQVTKTGKGVRVGLVQTGRIVRPFVGRTPKQLLEANVRKEMLVARDVIAAEARRLLK